MLYPVSNPLYLISDFSPSPSLSHTHLITHIYPFYFYSLSHSLFYMTSLSSLSLSHLNWLLPHHRSPLSVLSDLSLLSLLPYYFPLSVVSSLTLLLSHITTLSHLTLSLSPISLFPLISTLSPPLHIFPLSHTHTQPSPVSPNTPLFHSLFCHTSFPHTSFSLMYQLSPLSHISYLSPPPLYHNSPLSLISLQSHLSHLISPLASLLFHLPLYLALPLSHPSLSPVFYHTSLLSLNFSHLSRSSVFSRAYLISRISLTSLSFLFHFTDK